MAACGSLGPINIEPEDPWKQIKFIRDLGRSPSFKQIFGESKHFKDNNHYLFQNPPEASSPSTSPPSNSMIWGTKTEILPFITTKTEAQRQIAIAPLGRKGNTGTATASSINSDNMSICKMGGSFLRSYRYQSCCKHVDRTDG